MKIVFFISSALFGSITFTTSASKFHVGGGEICFNHVDSNDPLQNHYQL